MPDDPKNGYDPSRLDRMERMLDLLIRDHATFNEQHLKLQEEHSKIQEEHRKLQEAQIDSERRMDRVVALSLSLAETQIKMYEEEMEFRKRHDREMAEIREVQRETTETVNQTTENLNALIAVVDDIVRKRPPQ